MVADNCPQTPPQDRQTAVADVEEFVALQLGRPGAEVQVRGGGLQA